MIDLTAVSSLGLDVNSPIKAKVRAHNSRGWSDYSIPSTTFITAKKIPIKMASPIRDDLTDERNLKVSWTSISTPDNGDSPITSYNL